MPYHYIDTHCHLNFKDFKDDADEVIARTLSSGTAMIIVASEYRTAQRAIEYAEKYPSGVYAAIGVHPIHLDQVLAENHGAEGDYAFQTRGEEFDYQKYLALGKNKKVVAVGETGLDYYHLDKDKDLETLKKKQKEVFLAHLKLAQELKVPAIIHCREAHADLYPLLEKFKKENILDSKPWGVIHCFSGDLALAEKYLGLGLLISFTGIITFSSNWDEVIRQIPLEKIMIETDSPYLSPPPFRGKRNEPSRVQYIAKRIGEIKGMSAEAVGEATLNTACQFFSLDL